MAIPDFQSLMLPLLQRLADGKEHPNVEVLEALADQFHLSEDERKELLPSALTGDNYNSRSVDSPGILIVADQTIDSPSPYGIYDVVGNVREWSSTKSAPYPYNPSDGRENLPVAYNECCRILRGGSWRYSIGHEYLRCAFRDGSIGSLPDLRSDDVGFRCARSD